MFVHLNVHSHYSRMQGTASLPALLTAARQRGMRYLAITEVNGLWGFVRFVQHAHAAGIYPIAGVNLMGGGEEVVVLVENQTGYENLCRAVSAVHASEDMSPVDILADKLAGLFVLAYQEPVLRRLAHRVPNSHLFVELRPGIPERQGHDLARKFNLEIVATGDVYFLTPKEVETHRILRAIDMNTVLSAITPDLCKSEDHWFRSEKEMIDLFPNSLEAVNNSVYLAERCKTDWSFVNTIFPHLSLKATRRANRELQEQVYAGAQRRYGSLSPAIKGRIEYELDLIMRKGFAPYFLVVQDIVQQTRATIGRGSAAASIVSYCLFITQVDPIRYQLQFERFIHPERINMPDIDVDFPWDERDRILEYIFQKYGKERTAMVASQVFLKPRSAIREVAKVYGLSNEEIKSITKRIGWYSSRRDLVRWVKTDPRFANMDLDDTLLEIIRQSEKIIGVFRYPSVHPGGVVIVPDEIRKYVPVLTAPKGVQIVEWEKDQVEDAGLLKIDILGNRSLAVVRDTIRQIHLNYGQGTADTSYLDYHTIQPVEDSRTATLMKEGKTMGIFYIESPATRQLLSKAGVVDFEHVVIYSSIIRPAANRFITILLERIHGQKWEPLHPDLAFLDESYGIMVYEEQVSLAARVLAGFSYAEAEALRKTMSRDSMQHLIPGWQKKFYAGAHHRGYEPKLIDAVWDMIKSFVGYSFCKPHSASYAMLSFTCAYLKAHYPAEFLAAVISNQGGFYSTYAYLSEARRWGIKILPPDVNDSNREYKGKENRIRMGLMSISGLRKAAIETILEERKAGEFTSLADFLLRTELDLADAMALTNAGALTNLTPGLSHRQVAYEVLHFCLGQKSKNGELEAAEIPLYRGEIPPALSEGEPFSKTEKRALEIKAFGFPISEHPLQPYLSALKGRVRKARDLPRLVGQTVYLAGVYITRKETRTIETGDPMEFITLEDETDIYEGVLFPEAFQKYGDLLLWETLFILRGKVEQSFGVITVTIEKLGSLPAVVRKVQQSQKFGNRTVPDSKVVMG